MKEERLGKRELMDKRFALVDNSGELRYPYKKTQQGTAKFGFVVGSDRQGEGEYLKSIEDVIRAVVFDGKLLRVSVDPPTKAKGSNSLSLHAMREVRGYVIANELRDFVKGAPIAPMGEPQDHQRGTEAARGRQFAVYLVVTQHELEDLTKEGATGFLVRRSNWTTVDAWQAATEDSGERIHVLIQRAGETAGAMWAAEIESIRCNPGPTAVVEISGLGQLNAPVGHSQVVEFHTGQPLHEVVRKSDIPCLVGPAVADLIRQRVLLLTGDAEVVAAARGAEAEVNSDPQCADVAETVRRALVNARIGQGGYRKRMVDIWGGRCAVTECGASEVLVASHAKAWRLSSNGERLDAFNGLLLAAHVDRLFDAGLISFNDLGQMLISPSLHRGDLSRLGIAEGARLNKVDSRHIPYLSAHRIENGFES